MKDYNKETMAKIAGRSLSISTKQAIEICNFVRNKNIQKMKMFLEGVIKKEKIVPFTRFNKGIGHKPGIGPGRYPIKTAKGILMLLKSVESSAQFKGLNTSNLIIGHIKADKASNTWHYGRKRRRKMKRTNIEIILVEKAPNKRPAKENIKQEKTKND